MIKIMCCIFDKKANCYNDFFIAGHSVDDIKRQMLNLLSSNKFLSTFYSDFELYQIGTFNLTTGEFISSKLFICNLCEIKADLDLLLKGRENG